MYERLSQSQKDIVNTILSQNNLTIDEVKIGLGTKNGFVLPYVFIIPKNNNLSMISTGILVEDVK